MGWSLKMPISVLKEFLFHLPNRKVNFGDSLHSVWTELHMKDGYNGHEITGPWSAEHLQNCFVEVRCWAVVISTQSDFLQTPDGEPHPVFSASVWDTGLSLWKVSNVDVKHLNDKESTTSLGRLFQCLITVTVKKLYLICSLISAYKHWILLCLFH